MTIEKGKILPRNLTAQAAYLVPGNPTTSRPEDVVANSYPGLEVDVRNLDRRFFPGLVFDFVARNDIDSDYSQPGIYGARLSYVDAVLDPDLRTEAKDGWASKLRAALTGSVGSTLGQGTWYLEWIEQAGKRLSMCDRRDGSSVDLPFDGLYVWRLIRSLDPGGKELKIALRRRDVPAPLVELEGRRRRYTDPNTGVLNGAYQPGELMQSLCSPWQHDFQECLCHYWASNHPDVVFGEILPGEPILPGGAARNPEQANIRVDWLRANRARAMAASALGTTPANRPFRVDHHEINQAWQQLSVVIDNREIGARYVPPDLERVEPLPSLPELAQKIRKELAPLEMALAVEYLYAFFSVVSPEEAQKLSTDTGRWPTLAEDVTFVRQQLLLIAVSEMQHLRWANQLLWQLDPQRPFKPVLDQAACIPGRDRDHDRGRERDHALRPLDPCVLQEFIDAEYPSCLIDGAYAAVLETLKLERTKYPSHMIELVERIVIDGMQHESSLLHIQARLRTYAAAGPRYPYLRDLTIGRRGDIEDREVRDKLEKACGTFGDIIGHLTRAYEDYGGNPAAHIAKARNAMTDLMSAGEWLAARRIGIPFWPWP